MAQKRYWNYRDPDNVRDINRWMLGVLPKGMYYGFDTIDLDATLNLKIRHTATGQIETKFDNTASTLIGKFITPHGIVVAEDAMVPVNGVSANSSGNPRIDLVVANQIFIETIGGSIVTYSIIQGTPGAVPVAPALANALTQTIIGYLYVPNGTTALNSGGVTWTRTPYPTLGNRPNNFAYLDVNQTFTFIQSFNEMKFTEWKTATIAGNTLTIPSGANKSNIYTINSTHLYIDNITVKSEGSMFKLYNIGDNMDLKSGGNILVPAGTFRMNNGDSAEFVYNSVLASWIMTGYPSGEFARRVVWNRFEALQSFNIGDAPSYTISGQKLNLTYTGNHFVVSGITMSHISQISTFPNGTEISFVNNLLNPVVLKHNATPSAGYLGMKLPLGKDIVLLTGDEVRLRNSDGWYYISGGIMILKRTFVRKTINATL
jgi:hypothetical protein